jgi:hypothetical protein
MSLIIPVALRSISTVVPPIILDGTIAGLFVYNTDSYIYGSFTEITGNTRWRFASINNSGSLTTFFQGQTNPGYQQAACLMKNALNQDVILMGNSSSLKQLDTSTGNILSSGPAYQGVELMTNIFVDPNDNTSDIFIAGNFLKIGTKTMNGFAKFNNNLSFNTTWICLPSPAGTVYSLCSAPNFPSHFYAGGGFTSIDGNTTRRKIARIGKTGTGAVDTTFNFSYTNCSNIYSMAPSSNGYIFVGGNSTTNKPFFKCITTTGSDFLNLSGNIQNPWANYFTYCSFININHDNSKIYAHFSSTSAFSGTTGMGYLHRFNSDGTLDTTFNSPLGYVKFARFTSAPRVEFDFNYIDNRISVAGAFDWVEGTNKSNFVILNNDGTIFA